MVGVLYSWLLIIFPYLSLRFISLLGLQEITRQYTHSPSAFPLWRLLSDWALLLLSVFLYLGLLRNVSNSDDIRVTAVVTLMGPCTALPHTFTGLVVLTLRALTLAVIGNAFAATIGTVAFKTGCETRDAGDVFLVGKSIVGRRDIRGSDPR
jgi:hypothetical protein